MKPVELKSVLLQRFPTCGSRPESGSREPSRWVAKRGEKIKNKTFCHEPGEHSVNSRAFLDFRHDMDYTAILHIMEYRSIVFQTLGYKFIFVMFCKKIN